jgi:tRNA1(Val) A37 N6-methylase TrmN6
MRELRNALQRVGLSQAQFRPERGAVPEPNETLDAISGHFRLFQLWDGHRFSTDDILTAWYGTTWCPTAQTALDLGSGIGTVGMICAWRMPGTRFVTVEAQPESVDARPKVRELQRPQRPL